MRIEALCKKKWVQLGRPPVFKVLQEEDPEQNAGKTQVSIYKHLLVFKALRGDDPEHNVEKINASNPEHLIVFNELDSQSNT